MNTPDTSSSNSEQTPQQLQELQAAQQQQVLSTIARALEGVPLKSELLPLKKTFPGERPNLGPTPEIVNKGKDLTTFYDNRHRTGLKKEEDLETTETEEVPVTTFDDSKFLHPHQMNI